MGKVKKKNEAKHILLIFIKKIRCTNGFLLYEILCFDIVCNCAKYLGYILNRNENKSKNHAKSVRSATRFCDIEKITFFQIGALNRKFKVFPSRNVAY